MEAPPEKILADNLARVRGQIDDAARQAGRDPSGIRLIAVTKYHSAEQTRWLVEAGCRDLGESRPQELWEIKGDVPNVVFSNANLRVGDAVYVYYGGADHVIGLATCKFGDLLDYARRG